MRLERYNRVREKETYRARRARCLILFLFQMHFNVETSSYQTKKEFSNATILLRSNDRSKLG